MKTKALFLDRDGVINVDKSYVYKIEDFEFMQGVFETLRHFQSQDYLLIVITNQSGIGRGYYSKEDFLTLSRWMSDRLAKEGIHISSIYYCPHSPELKCECRKPKPKMLLDAIERFNINPQNSIMVGDKLSDVKAGFNAGVKNLFLIGKTKGEFFKSIKKLSELIKF